MSNRSKRHLLPSVSVTVSAFAAIVIGLSHREIRAGTCQDVCLPACTEECVATACPPGNWPLDVECHSCATKAAIHLSAPNGVRITRSNIATLEFDWLVDSGCGDCNQYGVGASFVLDGGLPQGGGYDTPILGAGSLHGGVTAHSKLQQANIFSFPCQHTLQIRAQVNSPGPNNCNNPGQTEVWSNPITVWIDPSQDGNGSIPACLGGLPDAKPGNERIGCPVDLFSGKMYYQKSDLRIDGPLPIELVRRYDSNSADDGVMGYGWQHNFMVRMPNPSTLPTHIFVNEEMRRVAFNYSYSCDDGDPPSCTGGWHSPIDHMTLKEDEDGLPWQVIDTDGKKYAFNEYGNLEFIEDRNGNQLTLAFDVGDTSHSRPRSITDSFGRSIELDYYPTAPYRLYTATAGDRTVTYDYDSSGNLVSVLYSDGDSLTYRYEDPDPNGVHHLTSVEDSLEHVVEAHQYLGGRVEHTESRGGTRAYDIDYGNPPSTTRTVTDALDRETTYTIDLFTGLTTRVSGPGCSSCGSGGVATTREFDDRLNLTSVIDALDVETEFENYDNLGNPGRRTEALGTDDARVTEYDYDVTWRSFPKHIKVPTVFPAVTSGDCASLHPQRITTLEYDDRGNLDTETIEGCDGPSATNFRELITDYDFDEHGRIVQIDGPRDVADVTTYSYYDGEEEEEEGEVAANNLGRIKSVTDAAGHVTTYSRYDYFGNAGRITDPNGVVTIRYFNFKNQVTEERILDNPDIVTRFRYDTVGNLDRVGPPECSQAQFEGTVCSCCLEYVYDAANQLLEVHDAAGNEIHYSYDPLGNKESEAFTEGHTDIKKFTSFRYDALNHLRYVYFTDEGEPPTDPNQDPISPFYKYTYFDDGTRETEQDPEGHVTTFGYDNLKRVTKVSNAETIETTYKYDSQDNLTLVIDPRGLHTVYTNSDFGWRLSTDSPDTGSTLYEYDEAGNLTASTDANGVRATREYDLLNRLSVIGYPTRTDLNTTYLYDEGSVSNGIGRRTGMIDSAGQSAYYYDKRGLLTQEDRATYGLYTQTGYDYDKNANLIEIRYPAFGERQNRANFEYDDANRVTRVTTELEYDTTEVADEFEYLPFGPRTAMIFSSELTDSRTFDTRYRLDTWSLGSLIEYDHTFDDDGNLLERLDGVHGRDRSFAYDELHRLTYANGPWCAIPPCTDPTYTYDENGNRGSKNETGTATSYSYVSGTNRLDTATTGSEIASYSYDDNGNTTDDDTHSYEYNEANRLEMVDMGSTAYYVYDGDGRRAIKATDALTYYFYDPFGRLLTEVRVNDVLNRFEAKDYIYVHDAPVARVDWLMNQGFARSSPEIPLPTWSDSLFFYHTDHLGTPIMMTSQSSVPVWQTEHMPFGDLAPGEPSIDDIDNNLRFPGQYFDVETGLHQNWFRDYDATTGRYLQSDPIGLAGGSGLYAFVEGSPTNRTDPTGLLSFGEAYSHYLGGSGLALTMQLSEIDTATADALFFDEVRAQLTGRSCTNRRIPINTTKAFSTNGTQQFYLGFITLELRGVLEIHCDCAWQFAGDVSARNDYFDFNPSTHRGAFAEALTWFGNQLPGTPYTIHIVGRRWRASAGKLLGTPTCCQP